MTNFPPDGGLFRLHHLEPHHSVLIKKLKLTLGDFYYETRNNNEKNIMPASIRCSFNG